MFINAAYLHDSKLPLVDESRPLLVTSCGNYRLRSRPEVVTHRPSGRKDYQLLYLAAGKGHFRIDGTEHILTAGTAVLYVPDQPQEYVYYQAEQTEVYWVHFTGSEADALLKRCRLDAPQGILPVGTSPDYLRLFGQMIQELQLRRTDYEMLTALLLQSLLIRMGRELGREKKYSDSSMREIHRAMHFFQEYYAQEINIAEYAASRGFSASWFLQCFRQITGSSPLQYILKLRLSNAQSLLENTDYPIGEIADAVGYDNALYFSRLFRKHIGMSPREYRRAHVAPDEKHPC